MDNHKINHLSTLVIVCNNLAFHSEHLNTVYIQSRMYYVSYGNKFVSLFASEGKGEKCTTNASCIFVDLCIFFIFF